MHRPSWWSGRGASAVRRRLRRTFQLLTGRRYPRRCPVCGSFAEAFLVFGLQRREDAQCPHCGALERHRLLWVFLERRTDLLRPPKKRLLHVAPERQLVPALRRCPHIEYLSADLLSPRVQLRLDLTAMPLREESVDVVLCNHVLEHIPDDRQAMAELLRVLRPSGWSILQVPVRGPRTVEDRSVTDPAERERLYGQADHVRQYGHDYSQRLAEAGFEVEVCRFTEELPAAEVELYGLKRQVIYRCRKRRSV